MLNKIRNGIVCLALLFAGSAIADPITITDADAGAANGTDVGSVDTIMGATTDLDDPAPGCSQPGNSSDPTYEECWAENVLGVDLDFTGKNEDVMTFDTSADDVIAFALEFGPGYYIIKNAVTWVLMENLADINWGVLNLSDLAVDTDVVNFGNLGEGVIISHVSELNGGGDETQVPEPATLGLLGLGLIGAGFVRRRRIAS